MPEPSKNNERAARFIAGLRRLRDKNDRGALAALRRGFSPATVMDAWPIVSRLGGEIGQPGESVAVDIAALFATHPQESEARNFGETCNAIAWDSKKGELTESFERRFRRLLASDSRADLSGQLRAWVRLAANKPVGVNYESLYRDLYWWDVSKDRTRVYWACSFWRSSADSDAADQLSSAETTSAS